MPHSCAHKEALGDRPDAVRGTLLKGPLFAVIYYLLCCFSYILNKNALGGGAVLEFSRSSGTMPSLRTLPARAAQNGWTEAGQVSVARPPPSQETLSASGSSSRTSFAEEK